MVPTRFRWMIEPKAIQQATNLPQNVHIIHIFRHLPQRCMDRLRPFSTYRDVHGDTSRRIKSALRTLSLSQGFHPKDLRDAYFDAAKKCHPDSQSSFQRMSKASSHTGRMAMSDDEQKAELSNMFLEITEAYDLLRKYPGGYVHATGSKSTFTAAPDVDENEFIISKTEEQHYREAVRESLGIDAEALEESKRCPMFREWLKGKSHMAYHFNLFLMRHGGLAPMLGKKNIPKISDGTSRRRRKR